MSTPFDRDPQRAIEAAVEAAELKRSKGDICGAYADYQAILAQRIGAEYIAADLSVIQSLADLAVLCGNFQAADDLLVGLMGICQEAGNVHRADFAVLKRIHLAIDRGKLRQAKLLFAQMAPRIGEIQAIEITPQGLLRWEKGCHWPNTNVSDRTILFAHLYLEMGRLLNALGQYCSALEMLNRGLTHATPGDSEMVPVLARRLVPWMQLAIARTCLEAGLLPEAEAVLDTLSSFLGSQQERSLQIQYHTLFGKLALLQGVFGVALKHFQQILNLCHQLKTQRGVAIASLNLAQVLILVNQNQLADDHLLNVAADIEQLDDPHLQARLVLLQRLAQARSQSLVPGSTLSVSDLLNPEPPPSSPNSDDSLTSDSSSSSAPISTPDLTFTRTQSPNYLTFFEDRVLEFQWYLSQSNLKAAAQLLTHIQEVFSSTDSKLIALKIKALLGTLTYYQGVYQHQFGDKEVAKQQFRYAALLLDEIRPLLANMNLTPERWQVQRVLGWCLMRLQASDRDQEAIAAETTQLLEELTHSLSPEDQVIFLLNRWTADEEYIATQIVRLRQMQNRLKSIPLYQRPRLWWQLLQRLNALMGHIDRYKDALAKRTIGGEVEAIALPTPTLWTRLLKQPRRRATLSFLVLPDQIFVVRNWFFWLDFTIVPTTRLELRNLIEQWYVSLKAKPNSRGISLRSESEEAEELSNISQQNEISRDLSPHPESEEAEEPPKVSQQSEILSQKLSQELGLSFLLETLPKRIRRLTIVPDDLLHIFPFAAVQYRGKYLVESYALTITYQSAESVSPLSSTRRNQPPKQALVVGISQGGAQFAALPGVMPELETIHSLLTQQQLHLEMLMNAEAKKASVLVALKTASLLHIACHGTFQRNQPDQSGLVLNPAQSPPEILSLREISKLNLESLHHVTLSACSSADHLVLPGRWVVSLPETLWRSGTKSILGSLWAVYDQMAIAFMKQFYTYLQTLPRDEALRQTQLDCLYNKIQLTGITNTSNPIYWAGFNLYGESEHLF
jgi:CHAT domain-containing protein/tetratricopeptide (TPR) repeat protein